MRWLRRHRVTAVVLSILLVLAAAWGVKLAQLSHSVGADAAYWAQPRGEAGGLVYVALGDSVAQGVGASRVDRGYVALLAERMRTATGRPVLVVNLSRSGATIRDVVDAQLPLLARLRPDVVTLDVGGNDVRSYDAARFATDVGDLTSALPSGTVVADVPYFMHGRSERNARTASQILTRSAQARLLPVVALSDAQRHRGSAAMLTDFAADWFHPNDRGHRVWADAFWDVMSRGTCAGPAGRPQPPGPSALPRADGGAHSACVPTLAHWSRRPS
jgi:acyl-CoA thioesterase I